MMLNLFNKFSFLWWLIVIVCVCLLPRMHSGFDIPNYLWSEDGVVFFNDAQSLGLQAILKSYASYLHLYPRLVSWGASYVSLTLLPHIYFFGWFAAFLISMVVITKCVQQVGLSRVDSLILVAFIILQPTDSEVLFSLTNSQWFIGLALLFATATIKTFTFTPLNFVLVVTASLTGPFSIIALCISICRLFLIKLDKREVWFYITILFGAFIQVVNVIAGASHLTKRGPMVYDFIGSIKSFLYIGFFGANSFFVILLGSTFWAVVSYLIYCDFKKKKTNKEWFYNNKTLILCGIVIVLNILAVFFAFRNPYAIMEMAKSGGGRYTLIPYTVMFFIGLYLVKNSKLKPVILFSTLIICLIQFKQADRDNAHFNSYANFGNYSDVIIPINPIRYKQEHKKQYLDIKHGVNEKLEAIEKINLTFENSELVKNSRVKSMSTAPIDCNQAKDIVIEVKLNKITHKLVTFSISDSKNFENSQLSEIFYEEDGKAKLLAFPFYQPPQYIGVSETSGLINNIDVYCIP